VWVGRTLAHPGAKSPVLGKPSEREAVRRAARVLWAARLCSSRGEGNHKTLAGWWFASSFGPWVCSKNQYLPTQPTVSYAALTEHHCEVTELFSCSFSNCLELFSEKAAAQHSWGQWSMPQYENVSNHCSYPEPCCCWTWRSNICEYSQSLGRTLNTGLLKNRCTVAVPLCLPPLSFCCYSRTVCMLCVFFRNFRKIFHCQ